MEAYPSPIATVDVALFTLIDGALHVALMRRDKPPHEGAWALPGGFVHVDEDRDAADTAGRVLREKTGLRELYLEQLCTFSGPERDPRGWSLSIAYYALVPAQRIQEESTTLSLYALADLPELAFDHDRILQAALRRLRGKSAYSSLPAFLLQEPFTLTELQEVYECVLGESLNRANFRQKILGQGVVRETAEARRGQHRPAKLYRLNRRELQELTRTI